MTGKNLPTWTSHCKLLVDLFPENAIDDDLFQQPGSINENASSSLQRMDSCFIDELLNDIIGVHDAVTPAVEPTSELENN